MLSMLLISRQLIFSCKFHVQQVSCTVRLVLLLNFLGSKQRDLIFRMFDEWYFLRELYETSFTILSVQMQTCIGRCLMFSSGEHREWDIFMYSQH